MYVYVPSSIYKYVHTYVPPSSHTYYMYMYMYLHQFTNIYTVHTYVPLSSHTYVPPSSHTYYMYMYMNLPYICTSIKSYIHMYMY